VARAVEACELQGVEAWIAASFIRTQIARPVFDAIGDKPMLVLRSTPSFLGTALQGHDRPGGRCIIILFTSPLLDFCDAIGIRLKSPGAPVFFSQMRAGRYGRPFKMWKFRTMVPMPRSCWTRSRRITATRCRGRSSSSTRIRASSPSERCCGNSASTNCRSSINVLRGDMSLVGPRPLPLYEVDAFCEIAHRRRLSVKPGITCEWQAGGRNKITSFEEWVEMDLRYIDNWSLWLDFKILLRTVPAVLFGKGAK
jgi:lipopolysaccharide/colanic/teichoic acid biosynthesis glycosyltransferase